MTGEGNRPPAPGAYYRAPSVCTSLNGGIVGHTEVGHKRRSGKLTPAVPKPTTSGRPSIDPASFLFPGPPIKFTQDNFGRLRRAPDYLPTFPLHPTTNARSGRDSTRAMLSQRFQKILLAGTGINPFCNNSYIYSNYAINSFSPDWGFPQAVKGTAPRTFGGSLVANNPFAQGKSAPVRTGPAGEDFSKIGRLRCLPYGTVPYHPIRRIVTRMPMPPWLQTILLTDSGGRDQQPHSKI